MQAKNGTNWDSNVFPKIGSALKAILDNDASAASLRAFPLNDEVVEKALMLKRLRAQLSMLAPLMNVTVEYVTFASQANVEAYLETKRVQLGDWLRTKLPSGSADRIEYVGDAKLVTRIRESNEFTAKLIFSKAPVRLGRALVGLVKLDDYLRFLRKDGSTVMRDELFAVNVRDYAGAGISVNNAIAETLAADTQSEFWWLNNGITLIADEARDPIELEWIITNPLIVNGLQTSNVFKLRPSQIKSPRSAWVKRCLFDSSIESDPSVREAIIAGTNNQTAIASIQLMPTKRSNSVSRSI